MKRKKSRKSSVSCSWVLLKFAVVIAVTSFIPVVLLYFGSDATSVYQVYRDVKNDVVFHGQVIVKLTETRQMLQDYKREYERMNQLVDTSMVPRAKFERLKLKALQISGDLVRVKSQVEKHKLDSISALNKQRELSMHGSSETAKLNATYREYFQKAKEQIQKLKSSLSTHEEFNERLEKQLAAATSKITGFEEASKKEKENEDRSRDLQGQLDTLKRANKRLENEAEMIQQEKKDIEAQLRAVQMKFERVSSKELLVGSDNNETTSQDNATSNNTNLEEIMNSPELDACNKRVGTLSGQLKIIKKRVEDVEAENTKLLSEKGGFESKLKSSETQRKDLESQLESMTSSGHPQPSTTSHTVNDEFSSLGFGLNSQEPPSHNAPQQQQQQTKNAVNTANAYVGGYPIQSQQPRSAAGVYPSQLQNSGGLYTNQRRDYQSSGANMYSNNNMVVGQHGGGFQTQNMFGNQYNTGMAQGVDNGFLNTLPQNGQSWGPCNTGQTRSFEFNVDHPGPSYDTKQVDSARRCKQICFNDGLCKAWVYVKAQAACYLKDSQQPGVQSSCCVSGLRC